MSKKSHIFCSTPSRLNIIIFGEETFPSLASGGEIWGHDGGMLHDGVAVEFVWLLWRGSCSQVSTGGVGSWCGDSDSRVWLCKWILGEGGCSCSGWFVGVARLFLVCIVHYIEGPCIQESVTVYCWYWDANVNDEGLLVGGKHSSWLACVGAQGGEKFGRGVGVVHTLLHWNLVADSGNVIKVNSDRIFWDLFILHPGYVKNAVDDLMQKNFNFLWTFPLVPNFFIPMKLGLLGWRRILDTCWRYQRGDLSSIVGVLTLLNSWRRVCTWCCGHLWGCMRCMTQGIWSVWRRLQTRPKLRWVLLYAAYCRWCLFLLLFAVENLVLLFVQLHSLHYCVLKLVVFFWRKSEKGRKCNRFWRICQCAWWF